jgi:hypothetical protein
VWALCHVALPQSLLCFAFVCCTAPDVPVHALPCCEPCSPSARTCCSARRSVGCYPQNCKARVGLFAPSTDPASLSACAAGKGAWKRLPRFLMRVLCFAAVPHPRSPPLYFAFVCCTVPDMPAHALPCCEPCSPSARTCCSTRSWALISSTNSTDASSSLHICRTLKGDHRSGTEPVDLRCGRYGC